MEYRNSYKIIKFNKIVDENIEILYGGPEVSYDSLNILKRTCRRLYN